ncbi:MAG: Rpn family recombination-promoting nuclease/putative transposase [Deltaproteobacteria bacterium]|nr:Rpn family recombination-promoting nuclease/putative transposase [Deltaproteobacteria bacterium]
MASAVSNPHDKFFKEILSDINNAKSFFQEYLPQDILKAVNLDTLIIQKDSFIEKDFKEFFSDMLYTVLIGDKKSYIYLLFEHKSKFDKRTPLQLLQYMIKIWQLHIKQKGFPLPVVIPLVLYHGEDKWSLKTDFGQLFDKNTKQFKAYIPDFNYILYDLSQYTDDQIKGEVFLKAALLLFKYSSTKDILKKLPDIFSLLRSIAASKTGLASLEAFFRYIYYSSDLEMEKLKKIASESLNKSREEAIMTLAQRLINEGMQKGRQEGRQEGMQKGMQKGMRQTIIDILESRLNSVDKLILDSLAEIQDFDKLRAIAKRAALINSREELTMLLN